jgi:hypothetical protein
MFFGIFPIYLSVYFVDYFEPREMRELIGSWQVLVLVDKFDFQAFSLLHGVLGSPLSMLLL